MRDINTVSSTSGNSGFNPLLPDNAETRAMISAHPILNAGVGYMGVFGSGAWKVFINSGTFVVPAGVTKMRRRCVGPGGNGQTSGQPGMATAGGGYVHDEIAVNPGETVTVTVNANTGGTTSVSLPGGSRNISATAGSVNAGGIGYAASGSINAFTAVGGLGGGLYGGGGGSGSQLGNGGNGASGNSYTGGGGGGVRHSAISDAGASAWMPTFNSAVTINAPPTERFPFDFFLGQTGAVIPSSTPSTTNGRIGDAGSGAGGRAGLAGFVGGGGSAIFASPGGQAGAGAGGGCAGLYQSVFNQAGGGGGFGGGGGSGSGYGSGGGGLVILEW